MYINKDILVEAIKEIIPSPEFYEHRSQLSLINVPADKIVELCLLLRDNTTTKFIQLTDITAIDWLDKKVERFEVVYFLYSLEYKWRLRIKVPIGISNPHIPSVTNVWEGADWFERETYDMYGIIFENHPDFRRFYMPEDYVDPSTNEPIYPLRKDFPLMGIPDSLPLPPYPEKYGDIK